VNWDAINQMSLNWIDWLIIVVLSVSTLLSLWRGFVREALSLASWVLAFVIAGLGAEALAGQMASLISNETGRYIAAYVLIFVAVLVVGNVVNAMMAKVIKVSGLSLFDRLLGTAFGFTRGLIIVLVVNFVARELLPAQNQQALMESDLMPHLELLAHWMRSGFMHINSSWNNSISV
jgi:membrane protein required for colicin V production